VEIYFGNVSFYVHPLGPSMEYQRLGEAAFVSQYGSRAVEYVKEHPGKFVRDSLRRAVTFWTYPASFWPITLLIDLASLATLVLLFKASSDIPLFIAVLATYPLVYYASQAFSRYRHPIEPLLYALAGCSFSLLRKSEF